MQPSDFLTILGLALAVWAIIPNKERRFIRLFFSNFELKVLLTSLVFIHYLMSFDWLKVNWFPRLSVFTIDNGIPSTTWAYIVSLGVIAYPVFKVSCRYFSSNHEVALIELYKSLAKENDIELLVTYIRRYHLEDIKTYLQSLSKIDLEGAPEYVIGNEVNPNPEYQDLIRNKRILFASAVYRNIIQNRNFILLTANSHPELFATVFSGMETGRSSNKELTYIFLSSLFEEKNQLLVQELKVMNCSKGLIVERSNTINIPILYSLLAHTEASAANHLWDPIVDGVTNSMKRDREQCKFLNREFDFELLGELWNQKIYIAIIFFKYMVRESIHKNNGSNMGVTYFVFFTIDLIKIIPPTYDSDDRSLYPSFAHHMIFQQIIVMTEWLEIAGDQDVDSRVIDIVECLGRCVHFICQADTRQIPLPFKRNVLHLLLSTYFKISLYTDNINAVQTREWLEKMFINLTINGHQPQLVTDEYLNALQQAWNNFAKNGYQNQIDNGSIQQFVTKVLTPLGLDE